MAEKEPTLSFNRETGMYEGLLLVQVDSEIFRRLLIKAVEEDKAADLTDPQTWTRAIASVGKISNWLDRPHVKVTPIESRQRPKSFTMVHYGCVSAGSRATYPQRGRERTFTTGRRFQFLTDAIGGKGTASAALPVVGESSLDRVTRCISNNESSGKATSLYGT